MPIRTYPSLRSGCSAAELGFEREDRRQPAAEHGVSRVSCFKGNATGIRTRGSAPFRLRRQAWRAASAPARSGVRGDRVAPPRAGGWRPRGTPRPASSRSGARRPVRRRSGGREVAAHPRRVPATGPPRQLGAGRGGTGPDRLGEGRAR
ncbi:PREDICTED: translation initiation factor IF-2-like [Chinchilla lanigera]|uniref:translation initiation factor IF-2-like n=1 Tax=Chinchilla lanigera TaxID=34839 RepID=UPI000698B537|nr:PREDICTED: translation initiation factor IF-2-like [Chinchilla lanigera]